MPANKKTLQLAQYIVDVFTHIKAKVVDIEEVNMASAKLMFDDGSTYTIHGKLAADVLREMRKP